MKKDNPKTENYLDTNLQSLIISNYSEILEQTLNISNNSYQYDKIMFLLSKVSEISLKTQIPFNLSLITNESNINNEIIKLKIENNFYFYYIKLLIIIIA